MLGSYTAQEAFLALVVAILTGNEIRGLLGARLSGRSRNVSRLLTHILMLALLVPWVGYTFYWVSVMESPAISPQTFGATALNLPYLLLGIGLLILATYEILSLVRARRHGHTSNISRLISHSLIVLVVILMLTLSVFKWNQYTRPGNESGDEAAATTTESTIATTERASNA